MHLVGFASAFLLAGGFARNIFDWSVGLRAASGFDLRRNYKQTGAKEKKEDALSDLRSCVFARRHQWAGAGMRHLQLILLLFGQRRDYSFARFVQFNAH